MAAALPELILNVDDNEVARYTKTRALRHGEYRVLEARTGQEALQLVRAHRPDLILLDVKLPDINGLEVCQIIKREFPTILVLQISASFVTPGDRTLGLDSGADSYLIQPVEPQELIAAVRALLRMRRAEQAAREINERYRVIVDSAVDYAIITLDLAGAITSWSTGATAVLGYEPDEVIGHGGAILFTDEDRIAAVPATEMATALSQGRAADERWMRRKGGGVFWASGQMVPLRDAGGGVNGFLKILRDQTSEKQAEEELRLFNDELEREVQARTRDLQEANSALRLEIEERERTQDALRQAQKMEAVGQLTGGIAHDFNNLLTVVIGGAEGLDRRLPPDAADLRRRAAMILEAARRAASLTHRLLAFSRQQALDPKPTALADLVNGMLEILRRTLGEHVEIETSSVDNLWLVSIDRNQLENTVLNLAVNARDAMPQGGKLTIQTANVDRAAALAPTRDWLKPGQHVRLTVRDTGTGMAKDVIDKAFDPFFTTKGVGQGTGLGLSQVYGFVKQSGGQIEIDSTVGEGTTINIYLPRLTGAADRGSAMLPAPAAVDVAPPGQAVLVVEDEDVVRAFSTEALREMGLTVVEAADGASALAALDHHADICMLFADLGLPGGLNGRQLADEVRRRRPEIKVLLTTGYTRNTVIHEGRLDEGVNLLSKPFTYETLAARVKEILAG